ncbi:MAG: hypothetical protein WC522_07295 [Candidatus Omnitrophota bacterium]
MKRYLPIFILLCFIFTSTALADQNQFVSDEQFSNWFTYYYLSPQPQRLGAAIKYFCSSASYKDKTVLAMMSFFVAGLKNDDEMIEETYEKLNRGSTIREKTFFLDILWLINTNDSRKIIEKAKSEWNVMEIQEKINQQRQSIPYDTLTMPIISPQALDMLWATFFSTGDEKVVQRIISVIHLSKDGKGQEILIGGAALWSLKSNAKQHKKVMDICKQEVGKETGLTKNLLQEIVAG